MNLSKNSKIPQENNEVSKEKPKKVSKTIDFDLSIKVISF